MDTNRVAEALHAERTVPRECIVLRDQHVGESVPRHVDELEVRVIPVANGKGTERAERSPPGIEGALVKPRRGGREFDQIQVAVSCHIHELLAAATDRGQRWPSPHDFRRPEPAVAQVGLVKPGVSLFGEHARDTLAVEIDPAIPVAVDPPRQVCHAARVDILRLVALVLRILQGARRVGQFERRQRLLEIAAVGL